MSNLKERNTIDLESWVNKAKNNPADYLSRQATEIFMTTLSSTQHAEKFFLKGGTLMGVLYNSSRNTTDIDYSTLMNPSPQEIEILQSDINSKLNSVTKMLGYIDVVCQIQSCEYEPTKIGFSEKKSPAITLKLAYTNTNNTKEVERIKNKKGIHVIKIDISFNEPLSDGIQIIQTRNSNLETYAYSIEALIAEKYRAFMQQIQRNRPKRSQDIYDLHFLISGSNFTLDERHTILRLMLEKCESRDLSIGKDTVLNPELKKRSKNDWHRIEKDLEKSLDFESYYFLVCQFYQSLPWTE